MDFIPIITPTIDVVRHDAEILGFVILRHEESVRYYHQTLIYLHTFTIWVCALLELVFHRLGILRAYH